MRFLFFEFAFIHASLAVGLVTDENLSEIDDLSITGIDSIKLNKSLENATQIKYNTPKTISAKTANAIALNNTTTKTISTHKPNVAILRSDVIDVSAKVIKAIPEPNIFIKIYNFIANAINKFITSERVKAVIKNIGTCIVNGALDIVSFYVPAPLIPIVASVAGMIIPFDPVVSLRERLPVTSYRRAMSTAVKSFLGTFDRYKEQLVDYDEDPYMTRRFNRRMMNAGDADDNNNDKNIARKNRRLMNDDEEAAVINKIKKKRKEIIDY